MSRLRRAVVTPVLKTLLTIVSKIDNTEYMRVFESIPLDENGRPVKPMIIVFNHINFLEIPILVALPHPYPVTGLVQKMAWKNPIMGFLFDSYDAIPLNREGAYLGTFRQVAEMIKKGFFVCISPEGKRSKDGILRKGKGGIVQLADMTGAAILPVAHFGGQYFWQNIKSLKRTPITFRVGKPFRLKTEGMSDKYTRAMMIDDVMAEIAKLLPEDMRGAYSEKAKEECRYIEYLN